ncbi:MAG: DUF1326 domain-containing protein [Betaproteobacteria bacterium]|nr:DUF1326 domain-containing protein [Betaproteobacteria bacterium]MDE2002801.1 DUF1326 domain-containing protein [Betaproteobacteria bacterium]MDE2209235.1 DUF1326 domain-containing protein [Betaproteobacteria bacterium]MDE2358093.1 DUF1326 domain-containing protein [Betaproteobacteria bacterium]
MTPWEIKGAEFANCNCSYGCPCQFNALPTHGSCCAVVGFKIESGRFGSVPLDGLRAAAIYSWPGPVHLGDGRMQLIIDERADPGQRDALTRIMLGQDTQEMATMWWVFSAMSPAKEETVFAPIDFEVDVDARRGRLVVPGLIESRGEPIRNPVTGNEHRVRIDIPSGFEYRLAEIGSGRTTTKGKIQLDLKDTYGQFARIHLSHAGIVNAAVAA